MARAASAAPIAPVRGPWPWAVGGLVLGLVFALVLFIPASWLASRIESASEGHIVLADARGSIWNGSASLQLTGGEGSNDSLSLPTPVDWHIRPRWNGFAVDVFTACCTQQPVALHVKPGWRGSQIEVADMRTQFPATLLAGLGTPWNTLQLDGDLLLSTQSLTVEWVEGRLALAGRAEMQALRMSSRLSTLRPMGSYRITVTGGATPHLQLETLEGALQLSGAGQWVGSRLHFQGTATAAPHNEEQLSNLLNIIGRRSGPRSIISIG